MCWSTVSNLSFRKFAVFASRFSWVFSPDICWSKSEVPEEHLQVLLLPKNFKVELDHWHLTANVSVFYTFLKFWHIKMSGSTTKYSFYRSITLEHVLKCSSPLYLCGILALRIDVFSPCFSIDARPKCRCDVDDNSKSQCHGKLCEMNWSWDDIAEFHK